MKYEQAVKKYGLPKTETRKLYGMERKTITGECKFCGSDVEREAVDIDTAKTEAQRQRACWTDAFTASFRDICDNCLYDDKP